MPIEPIGGASAVAAATQSTHAKESFAQVSAQVASPPKEPGVTAHPAAQPARTECVTATPTVEAAPAVTRAEAARVAERVLAAQEKLDKVLELAQSGKTFNTAELIALQAHVYGASQEIDLASKVVEKATSGLKTLLQTQL